MMKDPKVRKIRFSRKERIEQVKELREEGFTLDQMAEVMGITKATVRDYLYDLADLDGGLQPQNAKKKSLNYGAFSIDFEWQWPLVCNRILGHAVQEVPQHSLAEEIKFWKS